MAVHYENVIKINIVATGIANRLREIHGELPESVGEIQRLAIEESKKFEGGKELGPGFFLLDDSARYKFLASFGFDDPNLFSRIKPNNVFQLAQTNNDEVLESAYYLLMALLEYNDSVPRNKEIKAQRIEANGFDFVLRAFEGKDKDALRLFGAVKRNLDHEKLRKILPEAQLAPDMTLDAAGREFVNLMAKGIIRFCYMNNIAVPKTPGEFEKTVVAKAREMGADGGIAFTDLRIFEELLVWLDTPYAKEVAKIGQQIFTMDNLPPEIDEKISLVQMLASNPFFLSMQERAHWIRQWGGHKAESLAKAFENKDCQRRLVFKAIEQIQESRKTTPYGRKSPPITDSEKGREFVNILARGLIRVCEIGKLPFPETVEEFEKTLVELSRKLNAQAGLAFMVPEVYRDFYRFLRVPEELAGNIRDLIILSIGTFFDPQGDAAREFAEIKVASPDLARFADLVSAFNTIAESEFKDAGLKRSGSLIRKHLGLDYELIAQAFEAGDCQRDLVFIEMQKILNGGRT